MFRSCPQEKELTQALKAGHWPDGCGRELRAHVEACASCSDLVLVSEAFQRARRESMEQTPPGTPGLLWWRAQLRSRNVAAAKLNRPVTIAQIFAWLVTGLGAVLFVAAQYPHGVPWAAWWSEFMPAHAAHAAQGAGLGWNLLLLVPSGLVLLGGIVVYLATESQ